MSRRVPAVGWPHRVLRILRATLPPLTGGLSDLSLDTEEVFAPDLSDILLGVSAAQQLSGYVRRLAGIGPPRDPGAAAEVRADPHMVHTDESNGIIDVIDEMHDRGKCPSLVQFGGTFFEVRPLV